MKKTLVFILGLGHSGSTLLGNVLGAHPGIFHAGEIPTPILKGHPFRCYNCGDNPCPIWGEVLLEGDVRQAVSRYRYALSRRGRLRRFLRGLHGQDTSHPNILFKKLFDALPDIDIIVDKSMTLDWVRWHNRSKEYHTRYLLLLRDLRAVVASRLRRYPEQDLVEITTKQKQQLETTLAFIKKQPSDQWMTLNYETLVTQPEVVSRQLCDFLQINYHPTMLSYHETEAHIIGGNLSLTIQVRVQRGEEIADLKESYWIDEANLRYYQDHQASFMLDERWREELSSEMLATIDTIAGPLNHQLGY